MFFLLTSNLNLPQPRLFAKSLPVPNGNTVKISFYNDTFDWRISSITHSTVPSPPQIIM
jgi:hypothetical protein